MPAVPAVTAWRCSACELSMQTFFPTRMDKRSERTEELPVICVCGEWQMVEVPQEHSTEGAVTQAVYQS
jgi:hypothetical protein